MKKDFFKPEDFLPPYGKDIAPSIAAQLANKKLNAEIEKWTVVYTDKTQSHLSFVDEIGFTHKARLAFIEEIKKEPCKHEPEEFSILTTKDGMVRATDVFAKLYCSKKYCKHCKVEITQSWSEKNE